MNDVGKEILLDLLSLLLTQVRPKDQKGGFSLKDSEVVYYQQDNQANWQQIELSVLSVGSLPDKIRSPANHVSFSLIINWICRKWQNLRLVCEHFRCSFDPTEDASEWNIADTKAQKYVPRKSPKSLCQLRLQILRLSFFVYRKLFRYSHYSNIRLRASLKYFLT